MLTHDKIDALIKQGGLELILGLGSALEGAGTARGSGRGQGDSRGRD